MLPSQKSNHLLIMDAFHLMTQIDIYIKFYLSLIQRVTKIEHLCRFVSTCVIK